jgi:hypothetical protein
MILGLGKLHAHNACPNVQVISEENISESAVISERDADAAGDTILALMTKAMDLYLAITNPPSDSEDAKIPARNRTGQTDYRRLIICLLVAAEIDDLDNTLFCAFLQDMHDKKKPSAVYRTLTTQASISMSEALCVKEAYYEFVSEA